MDIEIIENVQPNNDSPPDLDSSPKSFSVISISEDDDEDVINNLISKIDKEKYSQEIIEAVQQLLRELDEKMRTEETIEILLSKIKKNQQYKNVSHSVFSMCQNKEINVCENLKNDDSINKPDPKNKIGVNTVIRVSDLIKTGVHVTNDMAKTYLDQQYVDRKELFRTQVTKSLNEVFHTRYVHKGWYEASANVDDFVAFIGLEEVVKNLKTYQPAISAQKTTNKMVCVQCNSEFHARNNSMSSRQTCEPCSQQKYLEVMEERYVEEIRDIIESYRNKEYCLDTDYNEMVENPENFEIFRQEQEKKLNNTRPSNGYHNSNTTSSISSLNDDILIPQSTYNPNRANSNIKTAYNPNRSSILNRVDLQRDSTVISYTTPKMGSTNKCVPKPLTCQQLTHLKIIRALNDMDSSPPAEETTKEQSKEERMKFVQRQNKETLEAIMRVDARKKIMTTETSEKRNKTRR